MKDTIVVDLDGTLADVTHRRHFVLGKKRNYEAFHAELHKDPVNEPVATIMQAMATARFRVIIVSARPKHVQDATIDWLQKNEIVFHQMFLLRATGDSTPDQDLKRAWLNSYGKDRVLFVIDDRQKVVDMWRAEGMTCLQCDAWEEGVAKSAASSAPAELSCPDCSAPMVLRDSRFGKFYGCSKFPKCKSAHGAHPDGRPLGIPADDETKKARIAAHASFDQLWKSGRMKRSAAYAWMQKAINLSSGEAHIGRFDKAQCAALISLADAATQVPAA